jgi:hypothetical protein
LGMTIWACVIFTQIQGVSGHPGYVWIWFQWAFALSLIVIISVGIIFCCISAICCIAHINGHRAHRYRMQNAANHVNTNNDTIGDVDDNSLVNKI